MLEPSDSLRSGQAHSLTLLTRLAQRRPSEVHWLHLAFRQAAQRKELGALATVAIEVAVEAGDPIGKALATFVDDLSLEELARLIPHCHENASAGSVPLRELALQATRRYLEETNALSREPTERQRVERIHLYNNLSGYYLALEYWNDALSASGEAVEQSRELLRSDARTFLPELAYSLHHHGRALEVAGRLKEAVEATREAVEIRERLVAAGRESTLLELAASFGNLANQHAGLGWRREARVAAERAVEMYRRSFEHRAPGAREELAGSLSNLGNRLADVGDFENAALATAEAVQMHVEFADDRPNTFRPALATALLNLGNHLEPLGHRREALNMTHRAVEIHRELWKARPAAFGPSLAASLCSLSSRLHMLGWPNEALPRALESIRLYRDLVERQADRFGPRLAISLHNAGVVLAVLEQPQEAVTLLRRMDDPPAEQLAMCLHGLGRHSSALGLHWEGSAAARESVALYRQLAASWPARFEAPLDESQRSLEKILRARDAAERVSSD